MALPCGGMVHHSIYHSDLMWKRDSGTEEGTENLLHYTGIWRSCGPASAILLCGYKPPVLVGEPGGCLRVTFCGDGGGGGDSLVIDCTRIY